MQHYAAAFEMKGLQPVQPYGVFSNFSADPLKAGSVALGVDYERAIDFNYDRIALKAGFGLTDDAEILATAPYVLNLEGRDGFEDFAVGFKHRVFSEAEFGPSIAYLLRVTLPNGRRHFSTEGSAGGGIVVSKKLGPFGSNVNLLYSEPFDGDLNEQIEMTVGFVLRAGHDFDILAELYALDSYEAKSFDTVEARFGYRIRTTDALYTLIGVGYDLKDRTPELRVMISLNFLYRDSRTIGY